jgi:anti-sigma28 factor (negative regulator of flagellin synthesis)
MHVYLYIFIHIIKYVFMSTKNREEVSYIIKRSESIQPLALQVDKGRTDLRSSTASLYNDIEKTRSRAQSALRSSRESLGGDDETKVVSVHSHATSAARSTSTIKGKIRVGGSSVDTQGIALQVLKFYSFVFYFVMIYLSFIIIISNVFVLILFWLVCMETYRE